MSRVPHHFYVATLLSVLLGPRVLHGVLVGDELVIVLIPSSTKLRAAILSGGEIRSEG